MSCRNVSSLDVEMKHQDVDGILFWAFLDGFGDHIFKGCRWMNEWQTECKVTFQEECGFRKFRMSVICVGFEGRIVDWFKLWPSSEGVVWLSDSTIVVGPILCIGVSGE